MPHVTNNFTTLGQIGFIAIALSSPTYAEIKVTVDRTTISQNQPLLLSIEGDYSPTTEPDFSGLEQNFVIIGQNTTSNTQIINGQTQQHTLFQLMLRPKNSGAVTIPAIRLGTEVSNPISLVITADNPPLNQSQPQTNQSYSPPPTFWNQTATPTTYPLQNLPAPANYPPVSTQPLPQVLPQISAPVIIDNPPLPIPVTPVATIATHTLIDCNLWQWLTGLVTMGWLLTWYSLRRHQIPFSSSLSSQVEGAGGRVDMIGIGVNDVQSAYQNADLLAAKNALLRWAAGMWPDNPPTNLSRLAARCHPELQRAILTLEQALYSPGKIVWNKQPVWEWLKHPCS